MRIPFLKMQGIGNDFILIDDLGQPSGLSSALTKDVVVKMCDRKFGVGCDQILWMKKPESSEADARMDILNSDGSTAEMCGNGIRAAALFLHRHSSNPGQKRYVIETLAGLKAIDVLKHDEVMVDMGVPILGAGFPEPGEELVLAGQKLRFFDLNMGNPHAVFFVDDVSAIDLEKVGPQIENHPRFPKRTNVEFVQVLNPSEIKVRVWERGAGITLACGTGACASATASLATGRVKDEVKVHLPGGVLRIRWAGHGKSVMMSGPAQEVFRGEFYAD